MAVEVVNNTEEIIAEPIDQEATEVVVTEAVEVVDKEMLQLVSAMNGQKLATVSSVTGADIRTDQAVAVEAVEVEAIVEEVEEEETKIDMIQDKATSRTSPQQWLLVERSQSKSTTLN